MHAILGILLISFPYCYSLSASNVKIEDKGYSGLVIAISPDVEESEELINAIKQTWTDASYDLYIATQSLAYFKNITILVPRTWNGTNRDPVRGNENYDQADVVIALPNPSFGNEPYTEQHGGCGEMGIRSHFTPHFLLSDESLENYGPRGKVVVHEWAHYRWGVFDETSEENPFYWDPNFDGSNGPEATRCPNSSFGEVKDVDTPNADRRCDLNDLDAETNSFPSNCVFFPYQDQYYHPNTSIMSYQYMDEVTTFCHDDKGEDDKYNAHNIYAPNDQNRLCGLKSTWTVIMSSADFKNAISGGGINVADTTPEFRVVRHVAQGQRFVLVLDTSGSMSGWKIETLRQASYKFITVSTPTGSWVGIVEFCDSVKRWSDLKLLDSPEAREDLAKLIPSRANGGTCIGCGIEEGIKVLEASGIPAGGHLVVITDGQGSGVENVYDEVLTKGIVVDTVYIQTDKNEILSQLTEESGGVWYFTEDGNNLDEIFNEISSTDSTESNSYQLQSETFTLDSGENFTSVVAIDKTIGLNTVFVFTWTVTGNIPRIHIKTPSGCFYTNSVPSGTIKICAGGSIHNVTDSFKTIKFHIPGVAEVGEWIYTVTSTINNHKMTSVVTSGTADNSVSPIIVESGMSQTAVTDGAATVVYAKVTQGYNPILGASVIATVNRPSPALAVTMDLYDNGAGADVRSNDGIYSRYFTEYSGQGRYSVEVQVGHKNASSTRNTKKGSSANYRPGLIASDGSTNVNPNGAISTESNTTDGGIQSEDIGEFTRVVSSGGFSYTGTVSTVDTFPPGQIIDARIKQNDLEDFEKGISVKFTAPGDDLDSGTADAYEIRYTYGDPFSLSNNFNQSAVITQSDLLQGNLSDPLPSGSMESFMVQTPQLPEDQDNVRLAIAVRAVDGAGNAGSPSNIAVTNFFIKPLAMPTTTTPTPTTPTTTTTEKSTTLKATTTVKSPACPFCQACDPNTSLYMILMSCLAVTTGIFLTSTIVLAVWLGKSNKQLRRKEESQLRGVDNHALDERRPRRHNNRVVPVVSGPPAGSRPVVAYVEEPNVHHREVHGVKYTDFDY